jgi:hypothetical protein
LFKGEQAMTKYVNINRLRPNNWFLDKSKLEHIREIWNRGEQGELPAVEVTLIDNELSLIDGHCRAFVALENGAGAILANVVEPSQFSHNLDWLIIFHRQGPYVGVKNINDLGKRVIDSKSVETRPTHISQRLGQNVKLSLK